MKNYGVYAHLTKKDLFSTLKALRKLLCNPKDQVVKEITILSKKLTAVTVKRPTLVNQRSDERQRSFRNPDCKKKEIVKHWWEADHNFSWDQKKVVDRESMLFSGKIKETIHSLKNPNHIYDSS